MYLTMNRFRIVPGQEEAFEAVWAARETKLPEVPGFVSFHLLRGPSTEEETLYASHTVWRDEASFRDWTRSEAFRAAHRGAGGHAHLYHGPPKLEVFSSVQSV
ncbi:antibiotic biosynthesis monooxygenase family protein [Falsirhodobacter algicola]|uniref:Antibiotic biosynthesis monooxygenase n=1 Tax=Falsirhodobacter algicola TaxID=2692330 RepID=A0A8J8MSC9_9RHOB|nr:antibiotic biosynthesis monooxygenase [Falsirhodobacter algicola]QUS35855.1 antibiotic biosynthesis monooxygenase [Falsirhodobacter algicola]